MKRLVSSLAIAAASLAWASTANAQVTLGTVNPGTSPYSGPTPTFNFDSSTPPTSGGLVTTGTNGLSWAQPYGSTGNYFAVGPAATTPGTIDLTSIDNIYNISFIWGSVDTYNTLEFLDSSYNVLATFVGNDIFNPATGNRTDPNTNPVVTFNLAGTAVSDFSFLRLRSTQNAFEIDNIAINAVPEPATWGMMLLGFAGIGVSMRRRRGTARLAQIA